MEHNGEGMERPDESDARKRVTPHRVGAVRPRMAPLILLASPSGARAWMWCVSAAVMGVALARWRGRKDRGEGNRALLPHRPRATTRAAPAAQNRRTPPAERKEAKKPDGALEKENAVPGAQRQGDAKRGRGQRSPPSRSAQKREGCGRGSDTDGMRGGRSEGS